MGSSPNGFHLTSVCVFYINAFVYNKPPCLHVANSLSSPLVWRKTQDVVEDHLAESVYTKVVNFHQPMVTSSFMKWLFGTFPSTKVQHVLTYIEHNVVHNSTKSSSLICWNGFVLQRLIRYRRISIGLTHLYTFILLYFLLDLNIFNNTNVLCEII